MANSNPNAQSSKSGATKKPAKKKGAKGVDATARSHDGNPSQTTQEHDKGVFSNEFDADKMTDVEGAPKGERREGEKFDLASEHDEAQETRTTTDSKQDARLDVREAQRARNRDEATARNAEGRTDAHEENIMPNERGDNN